MKIFRAARARLSSQNSGKTVAYLKYAVGEILLVVIGILIALQVNNWNERRKEDHAKYKLMLALDKEYQVNKSLLEANYKNLKHSNEYFQKVLNYSAGEYPDLSPDSLHLYLSEMIYPHVIALLNSVQNEAVSSGKLELLSDSLKTRLSQFQDHVATFQRSPVIFPSDLKSIESTKLIVTLSGYASAYNKLFPNRPLAKPSAFQKTDDELESYLKNPDVYALLYAGYFKSISRESWGREILNDANSVLEQLDKELKSSQE